VYRSNSKDLTGFNSSADQMKSYISDLGINTNSIHTIAYDPVSKNQTLAGARAFRSWLNKSEMESLNVISAGIHSRRTWYTYKKILSSKNCKVGVIYFELVGFGEKDWYRYSQSYILLLEELGSYFVNWISL